jgi:flagellar hook-associated protein 3 FlgL
MFNSGLRGILNVQAQTLKTQNQIATGKRVTTPSDDPVAAARILRLEQEQSAIVQYQKNIDSAENSLMLEETQLDAVTNLLFRVRELATQAGNGALSQSERKGIAAELETRLDELFSLANTRNSSGEYIFGGYRGEQAPFVNSGDGKFTYRGDDGQRYVQISDSTRVPTGDSGHAVFEAIPQATVPAERTAGGLVVRGDSGTLSGLSISSSATYEATFTTGAEYTIAITGPAGGGATGFEVQDAGGNPVPGGIGTFTGTGPLVFGGVSLNFEEEPAAGTTVTLATTAQPTISAGFITDRTAFSETFTTADAPLTVSITGFTAPDQYAYKVLDRNGTELTDLAGSYREGEKITVGGAEFRIVGGSPGSSFELEAPTSQSMLDTVGKLATQLGVLTDSDADKLRLQDLIAETLANIDNIESSVGNVRSQIGARLNTLDSTRELHAGITLVNDKVLSEIRDLDYAEAITRLTQENIVLQAAQQSFAQISKLSLFNFLR